MNTQKCISDSELGRLCEGDLTFEEKQALQKHIEACPDCKARWEKVCAGARYLEEMLSKTAGKARGKDECLSDQQLRAFVKQTLAQAERQKVQAHLARCSRCSGALADKFTDAYEEEGESWWSEYAAEQLFGLFARLTDAEIDTIASELKAGPVSVRPTAVIKLPVLEPVEQEARRLAAATGEGFALQKLRQYEPAFEFELTQFGEQIRITARSQEKTLTYQNCLARLELIEQDTPRFSRVLLIEAGKGQCILQPDQVKLLKLEKGELSLRLSPLITKDQLDAAGSKVYTAILRRLLGHKDPEIRCGAIEVIARICGLEARSLIEPLAETDKDESVRATAKKALNLIPSAQQESSRPGENE